MRILVIEDNVVLCENICSRLKKENYDVDFCLDGQKGLDFALNNPYDLILLDRMLPLLDGTELLKIVREKGLATPIIMVTALGTIHDKVTGLDAGADDYITKPFSMQELLARVRALCRRPTQLRNIELMEYKDITFDKVQLHITGPLCTCSLSKRESSLLEVFLQTPNKVIPREFIYSRVWGPDSFVEDGNIDNYIRFLRRRLETIGSHQKITTIRGVGYMLEDADAPET